MASDTGPNRIQPMTTATGDRTANVVFIVACVVLVAVGVSRLRRVDTTVQAREEFLTRGVLAPFALVNDDGATRLLCVVISSNCHYCSDSLPFYRRLVAIGARSSVSPRLVFVTMESREMTETYLRRGDIASPSVLTVARLPQIPGTPSIVLLDRHGRVQRSWVGRLSRRQEADVEALMARD